MESMRAWMNLQKKYWKSDADGNAGIEDGSLRTCKLMVIMTKNRRCFFSKNCFCNQNKIVL